MKKLILTHCQNIVDSKLLELKQNLDKLRESANQDSKSSMGDKYETGRAMVQLEQENLMSRYGQLIDQKELLSRIDTTKTTVVTLGSLVTTNVAQFFLSTGLGKVEVENNSVFTVALDSPIGQKLLRKKEGDNFELNGKEYHIQTVS